MKSYRSTAIRYAEDVVSGKIIAGKYRILACQRQFKKEGSRPVITKINVKGDEVVVRNPLLETIITLNTQALSYWRDLGLTPSGLKKINDQMAAKKSRGLSDMVADLLKED